MAGSPDVSALLDFTLLDVSAQDLFAQFLAAAAVSFPDWTPLEGSTEVVIAEAYALIGSAVIYAVNQLPGGVLEVLLRLFGLERSTGLPASGAVTIAIADSGVDTVIPAGTNLGLLIGGTYSILTTNTDLLIPAGTDSAAVAVTAAVIGADLNGQPGGQDLTVIGSNAVINEVTLNAPGLSGGVDPEDGPAFLARASSVLARLTQTLVTASQFAAAALEEPGVGRAFAIDCYNPASGSTPGAGTDQGHTSLVLATAGGAAVSGAVKAQVLADLGPLKQGGLILHLIDPTITVVPVTCTVASQLPAGTVQAAVMAALDAYLNPGSWAWSATVHINELIPIIREVPGVDLVVSVTAPSADVTLSGAGPLASAGAITVNVVVG